MRLYLLGVSNSLKDLLSGHFDDIISFDKLEDINSCREDGDVLIISDEVLNYEAISSQDFSKYKYTFYLFSNQYSDQLYRNIRNLCNMKDIITIPFRLTEQQIVERILSVTIQKDKAESNLFSFISVGQNIGLTTLTLNVAKAIAKNTDVKVGLLLLNAWDSGEYLLPDFKGNFLSDIKGKLANRLLEQKEEFYKCFGVYDNLYILGGNRNVRLERLYTKEEIKYLLDKSKEHFDVVIVDGGSHFDNAVMIQVLEESSFTYLVVNQQPKFITKWKSLVNNLLIPLGYKEEDFMLIVNQFRKTQKSASEISKELGVMLMTTIPYSKFGILSENDENFLYDYEDIEFNEAIEHIGKAITRELNISFKDETKKKKGIFSFGS